MNTYMALREYLQGHICAADFRVGASGVSTAERAIEGRTPCDESIDDGGDRGGQNGGPTSRGPGSHGTEKDGRRGTAGSLVGRAIKPSPAFVPKIGTTQEDAEVNLDHRAGGDAL